MYDDLEVIRKLRNRAAHSVVALQLDSPDVAALTERLVGANHAVRAMEEQKGTRLGAAKRRSSPKSRAKTRGHLSHKANKERMRLILTLSYIGGVLGTKGHIVREFEMPGSLKSKILLADVNGSDT